MFFFFFLIIKRVLFECVNKMTHIRHVQYFRNKFNFEQFSSNFIPEIDVTYNEIILQLISCQYFTIYFHFF